MKKILKLKIFRMPIIIIILAIIGAIWHSFMINFEKDKYEPVGDYISVGTYDAHYYSKGDGNVAFVLIAGAGTPCAYTDFYNLQNHLSQFGQTIAFDHAGIGWSSVTDCPVPLRAL